MEACINCGGPPVGRYTLVAQTGTMVRDEPFCQSCLQLFRGGRGFEVHESPVLVRGGNERDEDE